jgi:uncharacterized membrane protein YfcA
VGAAAGSRPELAGQGRRLLVLCAQSALGGAGGAVLLLGSPDGSFEEVVPWLVAGGAVLLLARDRLRVWTAALPSGGGRARWVVAVVLTGAYAGYFGAGAGIIMLAVLSLREQEPLAVSNAVKNITTGCANLVAGLTYLVVAPVDLAAAAALGSGAVVGSWFGPAVVRILPERPLRYVIGAAGLCLAAVLA